MPLRIHLQQTKLFLKLNERMIQYSNDFRFEEAMNLEIDKTIEKSQIKNGIDLKQMKIYDIFTN